MKNLFLLFLAFSLSINVGFAQDADKDMRKAGKALGKYHLNPTGNEDELKEAKKLIDRAMASGEISGDAKAWITKGEIYNALAAKDAANITLDPNAEVHNYALVAHEAFQEALDASMKNWETKDALKGMSETSGHLNAIGYAYYQKQDFEKAYQHFKAVLEINDTLKSNDMDGVLGDEKAVNDQYYITGVSAMSAGKKEPVAEYFGILDQRNFDKPVIYEGLYHAYIDTDEEKALAYLAKGRERFPGEKSILFAEINHYLKKGELESLIEKLEKAAELEPDNASIYTTLGNVYDQQYQKELDKGNFEKAEPLFEKAKENYDKALEITKDDFAATYSIGALYYNKAAAVSVEVNKLADDYSKEGTQKYEVKKAEMDSLFSQALPWFEKAEQINSQDMNTMIALKEIHARQNNFEKSNEYKAKIEALAK
ncbi:MAG: tetratricopeptide repeat protein [Saprospiraceae bacterium]|nr:tetratricopeptide repeat protein [Saprospiraceae bacterium]